MSRAKKILQRIKIRRYFKKPNVKKQKGGYNLERARELNVPQKAPDDYNMLVANRPHWGSVDPETGMWLKSKQHPTAWMEYKKYALNPELQKKYNVVANPEGPLGKDQLQYVEKKMQDGGNSRGRFRNLYTYILL